MADESKQHRVVLKGPALVAAKAIQEELQLSNLSDAISVFVDRCNRGQLPVQLNSAESPPVESSGNAPDPIEF